MPIFYCPICSQLQGGWLCEIKRAAHIVENHPGVAIPDGCGLAEWHAWRKDKPIRANREIQ
jgi:hypothetical protein